MSINEKYYKFINFDKMSSDSIYKFYNKNLTKTIKNISNIYYRMNLTHRSIIANDLLQIIDKNRIKLVEKIIHCNICNRYPDLLYSFLKDLSTNVINIKQEKYNYSCNIRNKQVKLSVRGGNITYNIDTCYDDYVLCISDIEADYETDYYSPFFLDLINNPYRTRRRL